MRWITKWCAKESNPVLDVCVQMHGGVFSMETERAGRHGSLCANRVHALLFRRQGILGLEHPADVIRAAVLQCFRVVEELLDTGRPVRVAWTRIRVDLERFNITVTPPARSYYDAPVEVD